MVAIFLLQYETKALAAGIRAEACCLSRLKKETVGAAVRACLAVVKA